MLLLQTELASAIAAAIGVQLGVRPTFQTASERRVDPDAYEACLRARFHWNRRTREDLYQALRFFTKSIEKDLNYAPAFAGLADTYLVLLDYRYVAPGEALAMATAAAVAWMRARTPSCMRLDWDGAEQEFQRAIPQGPVDEALEACRKALRIDPNLPRPHDDLGRILLEKGAWGEAIASLEKAVSPSNRSARFLSSLGYGYGITGRSDLARQVLDELTEMSKQQYIAWSDFAFVHTGMGETDQAIQCLERAYDDCDAHLMALKVDPRLASLRDDPRFKALLTRVGLEP